MPLSSWRCIGNDARFSRVNYDPDGKSTPIRKEDHAAVQELQEDFVRYFGLNDKAILLNSYQNKLMKARVSAEIDGNRIALNDVRRWEFEIQQLLGEINNQKITDIDKTIILLENDRGFEIDEDKITVFKFHKLQEMYTEKMEQLAARQRKNSIGNG